MSDITAYDDQLDSDVAALFCLASQSVPAPRGDLIEAAVTAAEARMRARRRRHLVGFAASAALIGCLGTLGVVAITDGGPGSVTVPVAVHFGVAPDQMAPTLAQTLVDAGQISASAEATASGAVPAWAATVEQAFGITLPQAGAAIRAASATYQRAGRTAKVAVVIEHRSTHASMTDVLPTQIVGPTGGTVERSDAGIVLYQGGKPDGPADHVGIGVGPAVATLMTDDGWVVRALTLDLGVVPLKVLAQVAENPVWLG